MPTFDFQVNGPETAAITGSNTVYTGANFSSDTAYWTEGGVSFAYSHTGVGTADIGTEGIDDAVLLFAGGANGVNGTLMNVDTDTSQQNFWGFSADLVPTDSAVLGTWVLNFIQTRTIGGATQAPVTVDTLVITENMNVTTANGSSNNDPNLMPVTAADGIHFNQIQFTSSSGNVLAFDSVTMSLECFCAGTRIATPEGPRRVEDLAAGDMVLTAEGHAVAVRWLGEQRVSATFSDPARVNPIRISAGALGQGLPERDMLVSPDHALALDGLLVNAGLLVNGSTIAQVRDMGGDFTYYHVEVDGHRLLLAEGVAAESYLEQRTMRSFSNATDRTAVAVAEMDMPRITARRLLPRTLRNRIAAGARRAA
ncbi:Hint domain-containing protein [Psychromarinibacter sp. S121]|uniref:Hint domain-containing protein n=1 Tax=Psychromarinibacter sp. S121 TaxID=3415127 RepID=UPI003C7CCC26